MAQVEPYGIDKLAVDDLIVKHYEDRPSTLRNFSEIFLQIQKNLVPMDLRYATSHKAWW